MGIRRASTLAQCEQIGPEWRFLLGIFRVSWWRTRLWSRRLRVQFGSIVYMILPFVLYWNSKYKNRELCDQCLQIWKNLELLSGHTGDDPLLISWSYRQHFKAIWHLSSFALQQQQQQWKQKVLHLLSFTLTYASPAWCWLSCFAMVLIKRQIGKTKSRFHLLGVPGSGLQQGVHTVKKIMGLHHKIFLQIYLPIKTRNRV